MALKTPEEAQEARSCCRVIRPAGRQPGRRPDVPRLGERDARRVRPCRLPHVGFGARRRRVELIASAPVRTSSRLRKAITWASFLLRAAAGILAPGSPKRILLVTNPPLSPLIGLLAHAMRGSRYVLLFYDVYPRALTAFTPASPRSPIVRLWHLMNRVAVSRAQAVVTISDDLAREVARYLVPGRGPRRVDIVPTWVDTARVRPVAKGVNAFAVRHGQVDRLTVLYAGNLGAVHDLSVLPDLAESQRENPRVQFLVVGDGTGRAALQAEVSRRGLPNVAWLPPQPEGTCRCSSQRATSRSSRSRAAPRACRCPARRTTRWRPAARSSG